MPVHYPFWLNSYTSISYESEVFGLKSSVRSLTATVNVSLLVLRGKIQLTNLVCSMVPNCRNNKRTFLESVQFTQSVAYKSSNLLKQVTRVISSPGEYMKLFIAPEIVFCKNAIFVFSNLTPVCQFKQVSMLLLSLKQNFFEFLLFDFCFCNTSLSSSTSF